MRLPLIRTGEDPELVLPGVTGVQWVALGARDVPKLLGWLVSDPGREGLRERLGSELGHCGLLLRAAPHAVPFLLRIAEAPGNPLGSAIALDLMEEIAYGEPDGAEIAAGITDLRERVESALEEGRPFFERMLHAGDPLTTAQAIAILAGLNGRTERLRALLADPALDRSDEHVAAALTEARRYLDDE
jgi:hypothetical protein